MPHWNHWNYRIIHWKTEGKFEEDIYFITEIHYNDKDEITGWPMSDKPKEQWCSVKAMEPLGLDLDDLRAGMNLMKRAFKLPVLELKDLEALEEKLRCDV